MDDLEWLRQLDRELWPESRGSGANRTLSKEELERVFACIEKYKLVAEMYSIRMFGGYGMQLYEQEPYPGTGAQFITAITEDHLPVPTRYDHIAGNVKEKPLRRPGCGRDDAWEIFSKYTHSDVNRAWLKKYRLETPRERSYYDY